MASHVKSLMVIVSRMGITSKPVHLQKEIKMFRNRWFSVIVAAMFVVVTVLAVQRVLAAKAIVPEINHAYIESNEWALHAASSLVEEDLASLSHLSRLNPCFDLPFSELATCPDALSER
jgi:hypothetical protein